MKLKKITKQDCTVLRDELNGALADLGKKYGVKIKAGNAVYTDNSVTFKVEFLIDGFDKNRDVFNRHAFMFKLKEEQFGAEFEFGGRSYTLVGLKPGSPKYPIIGERDGGRYKLPERAVASLIEQDHVS